MKLRDFKVGETVTLKGAYASDKPLFIGNVDKGGYHWLWANRDANLSGAPYVSIAAGSHLAELGHA